MAKIEISTIRESAASIQTLNDGYLLYQKKQYSSFEFEIIRIPTLKFIVSASFEGVVTTLTYTNKAVGNCQCNLKGLCKHEICLFFLLRDKLNEIFKDKQSEENFFAEAKQDELMQDLMEINITRNVYSYCILPVISYLSNKLYLSFRFYVRNHHSLITNIEKFLLDVELKNTIVSNNEKYNLDYKYFDYKSQKLLDLCYLNRKAMTIELEQTLVDNEMMTFIYSIYKDSIFYNIDYITREISFKEEMPNVKILIEGNRLSLNNLNFQIVKTHSKTFVFTSQNCYVISGEHKIFATLLDMLLSLKSIDLNKNNYEILMNNIYPIYHDFFSTRETPIIKEIKIDTYLDYQNHQLKLKYKGNFKDEKFYLIKKNYKLLIKGLGFNKSNDYTISNFDEICDVLNQQVDLLKEYGNVYLSENVSKLKFKKLNSTKMKLNIDGPKITLSFEDMHYSSKELMDILIAYKENHRYLKLKDGDIVQIDEHTATRLNDFVNELGLSKLNGKETIPLYQAYYIQTRYSELMDSNDLIDRFSNHLINYKQFDTKPNYDIDNILRDYQREGFKWLSVLSHYHLGGILADDMGLGKTLEIISLIDTLPRNRSYLIVAPTSLIFNWESEFNKFAPHINVSVIYGASRTKKFIEECYNKNRVIITSYESIRMDVDKYEDFDFKLMIIDEAQFIKNPDALKTQAVKRIKADSKFALTGTPIENSLLDLWSIFDFVLPQYLKSRQEFIKDYQGFTNKILLEELNKKTSPFILRRLKGDVLDLEDKIETNVYSIMSEEERKLYDKYLLDATNEINNSEYKLSHILSIITRLRELSCEPRLFLDNVSCKNSKMDMMMEIIDEKISDNHKILVFSQFTSIFPYMEERLEKKNIKWLKLTGKTDTKERILMVDEFNSNSDIKVFLISLKAGGTGLNLTSADTVIHYDPWWNIAAMNQATDRAHRIGQKNIVHVIKLINKDTIEDKILALQEHKKYLSDEVINDNDIIGKLTKDDIKELFKK